MSKPHEQRQFNCIEEGESSMTYFVPPTHEEVAAKAFEFWFYCGQRPNDPLTDVYWFIAESMLKYSHPEYP